MKKNGSTPEHAYTFEASTNADIGRTANSSLPKGQKTRILRGAFPPDNPSPNHPSKGDFASEEEWVIQEDSGLPVLRVARGGGEWAELKTKRNDALNQYVGATEICIRTKTTAVPTVFSRRPRLTLSLSFSSSH